MAAQHTIPRLPVELIEQIILSAWRMPLSSDERLTFMRSSILVNSTWADIFDLISSRDVYIPSSAFCDHFIQRLRAQPPAAAPSSPFLTSFLRRFQWPSEPPIKPRSANLACQSLTIQIANVDVHPDKNSRTRLPMGAVLDDLLENLDARSLAPNLRRLTIEYLDAGFDDIFRRDGLGALPTHITHLEVLFSFSPEMPPWLVTSLREKQQRQRAIAWVSPSIENVSICGAGENTIRDLLRVCPNTRTLMVDSGTLLQDQGLSKSQFTLDLSCS
ncbi:hypothetical protein C8R44DRAFT_630678 [Mycena epipterygia]|nr:hypothetical protein C8R44DRAFT_630678 [Mycena epipterygia]